MNQCHKSFFFFCNYSKVINHTLTNWKSLSDFCSFMNERLLKIYILGAYNTLTVTQTGADCLHRDRTSRIPVPDPKIHTHLHQSVQTVPG